MNIPVGRYNSRHLSPISIFVEIHPLNSPLRFYLIDDDDDDRELFRIALDGVDHPTHYDSAASCSDALIALRQAEVKPDVIFLDLNMPEMNGKECLQELKRNAELLHIPVVIFSTSKDPRDKEETKAMGAIQFITKPARTSELKNILTDFIAQLHSQKPNTSA